MIHEWPDKLRHREALVASRNSGGELKKKFQVSTRSLLAQILPSFTEMAHRWVEGNLAAGDVCVFKLEAHQLSLRVQRLGGQTFTLPTNGAPGLRVLVSMYKKTRVQLSRAEPGEEY